MGSYKCSLQKKLKSRYHDEYHSDWSSYICPILRDEICKASEKEDYKRLQKLLLLGIEAGQIQKVKL